MKVPLAATECIKHLPGGAKELRLSVQFTATTAGATEAAA